MTSLHPIRRLLHGLGLGNSFLVASLLFLAGCADLAMDHPQLTHLTISADEAAQRAAQLANDECERQYHERPFLPEQHTAVVDHGRYRWGGDETNALSGLFALVTLDLDGLCAEVTIYYHTYSH
jgi:hypothetical protein